MFDRCLVHECVVGGIVDYVVQLVDPYFALARVVLSTSHVVIQHIAVVAVLRIAVVSMSR